MKQLISMTSFAGWYSVCSLAMICVEECVHKAPKAPDGVELPEGCSHTDKTGRPDDTCGTDDEGNRFLFAKICGLSSVGVIQRPPKMYREYLSPKIQAIYKEYWDSYD